MISPAYVNQGPCCT